MYRRTRYHCVRRMPQDSTVGVFLMVYEASQAGFEKLEAQTIGQSHGLRRHTPNNRVIAENLVVLGFVWSVSCIKSIPTHDFLFCCGKKWPKCHF